MFFFFALTPNLLPLTPCDPRIRDLKAQTDQRITDMEMEIGRMAGQQSALEQELRLGEVHSRDRRRRVTAQVRDLEAEVTMLRAGRASEVYRCGFVIRPRVSGVTVSVKR